MEHIMKLYESSFEELKTGKKKREYRLNDEKRRLVRIGDTIRFLKLPNLDEEFVVDVKGIETLMRILKIDMKELTQLCKILMMVVIILKKNQNKMVV